MTFRTSYLQPCSHENGLCQVVWLFCCYSRFYVVDDVVSVWMSMFSYAPPPLVLDQNVVIHVGHVQEALVLLLGLTKTQNHSDVLLFRCRV